MPLADSFTIYNNKSKQDNRNDSTANGVARKKGLLSEGETTCQSQNGPF